jgi:D-alanyl-D-alanine carboxypeptidase
VAIAMISFAAGCRAPTPSSSPLATRSVRDAPNRPQRAAESLFPATAWPADGQAAYVISGQSQVHASPRQPAAPIASVAKLMTAYVILRDHPLPAGGPGPDITVGPSEAAAYSSQARDGDSLVAVEAGEEISERYALEALLLPSADNMAWILARWDAGSQAAFVARMNAAARHLGMTVIEQQIPRELLYISDEVFFTGTAAEITPIKSVDRITVGKGSGGPITRSLQKEFYDIVYGKVEDRFNWFTAVPVKQTVAV